MSKPLLLIPGEIVHATLVSPEGDAQDSAAEEYFVYIVNSIKRNGETLGYYSLPLTILSKTEESRQEELRLLKKYHGQMSERIPSNTRSNSYYRMLYQPGELPADGSWKFVPIDRIHDITTQKTLENAMLAHFTRNVHSFLNGSSLIVPGIATSRTMPRIKDEAYYIDIDVHHAATAGYIPIEVADILKKHGKIERLGTASDIAKDPNPDKLRQIYDKARPHQSIPFDAFLNYIKTGMSYYSSEMTSRPDVAQAKLPDDAIVKFSGKEKIKFHFVERRPDLSIKDAFDTYGYILNKETYDTLKAAGFKTLRAAADMVEEHGVSVIRQGFRKAAVKGFTPRDIAKDIREANEALMHLIEHPDQYSDFDWSTQTHYPLPKVE